MEVINCRYNHGNGKPISVTSPSVEQDLGVDLGAQTHVGLVSFDQSHVLPLAKVTIRGAGQAETPHMGHNVATIASL